MVAAGLAGGAKSARRDAAATATRRPRAARVGLNVVRAAS